MMLECYLTGFAMANPYRSKLFTPEFFAKKYEKIHKDAFGKDARIPIYQGYPDSGNGRYFDELSYEDWMKFNIGQRIHKNFLESIWFLIIVSVAVGLVFPFISYCFLFLQVALRLGYAIGYA